MHKSRTQRLTTVGVVVALIATFLALASGSLPNANAAPGKIPNGAVTFTTLDGTFDIGGGSIQLPIRHPNVPAECADGVDNELGEFHGVNPGDPGFSSKDGLVDFAGSGTTGYAESNAGEATASGLQTFPKGCTSGADDNELFAHTMGINPGNCSIFGCNTGLVLPDPQVRQPFAIGGTVAANAITLTTAGVAIPDNLLLFGSCVGSICVNYIAQVKITANNNELQQFNIDGTGGTFTLSFNGATTPNIPFNTWGNTGPTAGVDSIEEYLAALPSIGAGNVKVIGGIGADGGTAPYRVEFTGALAGVNQPQLTVDGTLLTSTTPPTAVSSSTVRQGGSTLTGVTNNDGSGGLVLGLDVQLNLFKSLDSDALGPSTASCRTSITLNLTTETSGVLTGERFDATRSNLEVVDGLFTMPPFAESAAQNSLSGLNRLVCDGANGALGLWDGSLQPSNLPGDNEVRISASTAAGPWDTAGNDVVANAGTDQAVNECDAINLDGTGSWNAAKADPTVQWTQTAGGTVMSGVGSFKDASSIQAQTVAPPGDDTLTFNLSYQTLIGPHPANTRTNSDTVNVTVANVPPSANAGPDFATSTGKASNPLTGVIDDVCTENADLSVLWTQTGGPAAAITNPTSPNATFTTVGVAGGSTLTFQLAVGDGDDTTLDTVTVNVDSTTSGAISGHVQTAGGTPLAGIHARIYTPGGYLQTAITNGSGDYTASGLTNGNTYAVMFHDPSGTYQRLWYGNSTNYDDHKDVIAPDGSVDGVLTSEAGTGVVSGNVVDANTGAPLSGVNVVVHDLNGAGFVWDTATNQVVRGTAVTDALGNYSIPGFNPGTYFIRYQKTGYLEQWYDGKAWNWTADPIAMTSGAAIGSINGRLTANADRATLQGTVVQDDGVNEVQTINITSGASSARSMFQVTFGGTTLVVSASQPANDLENDLERLPGLAGNIDVTGTPGSYAVEFVGALAHTDVAALVVASVSERQALRVSAVGGAGVGQCAGASSPGDPVYTCNYTLDFGGQVTAPIPFASTGAQIQTALEALSNIAPGDVVVTPAATAIGNNGGGQPATIAFGGTLANQDVPEIIASPGTAESMGNFTQGASVETIRGGSTAAVSTTVTSVAPTPLVGVDVRAYSASKGKYVILGKTNASGAFLMRLPLDTYIVRIVDQVNGNEWEWYDDITAGPAGPAHIVADEIDLTAPSSVAVLSIELAATPDPL